MVIFTFLPLNVSTCLKHFILEFFHVTFMICEITVVYSYWYYAATGSASDHLNFVKYPKANCCHLPIHFDVGIKPTQWHVFNYRMVQIFDRGKYWRIFINSLTFSLSKFSTDNLLPFACQTTFRAGCYRYSIRVHAKIFPVQIRISV